MPEDLKLPDLPHPWEWNFRNISAPSALNTENQFVVGKTADRHGKYRKVHIAAPSLVWVEEAVFQAMNACLKTGDKAALPPPWKWHEDAALPTATARAVTVKRGGSAFFIKADDEDKVRILPAEVINAVVEAGDFDWVITRQKVLLERGQAVLKSQKEHFRNG